VSQVNDITELPSPKLPLAVARVLVDATYHHEDSTMMLRRWRGSFLRWTGPRWVEMEDSEMRSLLYKFTENADYIEVIKGAPEAKPWAPNRYKIADLADALGAITHLSEAISTPSWIGFPGTGGHGPPANEIVAVANGLLHVTTRTLMAHHPAFFNEVAVPFAYSDTTPIPTRWLEFLDQLWPDDPDAIAALQEFVGYVISGRTDLHKILLLIGPTRAGKGVIARILKALIGDGNAAGPTLAALGTNFGLSPLIGKPLAIVSDARLGGSNAHQIVERLLSISGEDMLTIDRKYREPWTGTLPTRFVVISNELPRFGDASGAIANRMLVLTLGRSWLGRENPSLTRELLGELPGILSWALDGLDRLNTIGRFTEPASSIDACVSLQDLASPTSAFVRDACVISPEQEVVVSDLFAKWKTWCDDNGRDRPGTVQTFGRDLRAVVPGLQTVRPRDGDGRERRYVGVGLVHRTHIEDDRGPVRTESVVRDGPRPAPLSLLHGDGRPEELWDQDGAGFSA
jgi:putative DNA primase/helicase